MGVETSPAFVCLWFFFLYDTFKRLELINISRLLKTSANLKPRVLKVNYCNIVINYAFGQQVVIPVKTHLYFFPLGMNWKLCSYFNIYLMFCWSGFIVFNHTLKQNLQLELFPCQIWSFPPVKGPSVCMQKLQKPHCNLTEVVDHA